MWAIRHYLLGGLPCLLCEKSNNMMSKVGGQYYLIGSLIVHGLELELMEVLRPQATTEVIIADVEKMVTIKHC